jgi:hypothetical protein
MQHKKSKKKKKRKNRKQKMFEDIDYSSEETEEISDLLICDKSKILAYRLNPRIERMNFVHQEDDSIDKVKIIIPEHIEYIYIGSGEITDENNEVVSLRTHNSRTYQVDKKRYMKKIYTRSLFYKDKNTKKWKPIKRARVLTSGFGVSK